MKNFVSEIKNMADSTSLAFLSEEELEKKIQKVKQQAKQFYLLDRKKKKEKKNFQSNFLSGEARTIEQKLLVEWFALIQETSFRTIGLRHFDTQLFAGFLLHQGKIVEMKTGEGKTLASTLPIGFNALNEQGVHLVTVNDYLAERDQKWMGKIYQKLGLSVGLVKTTSTFLEKKKSYNADITYVTNSELVFDYLRDTSAYDLNEIVQKPFSYCIVDEIDSILIDEARTPLILSSVEGKGNSNKLYLAKIIAQTLEKNIDFEIEEKRRDLFLTEKGYKKVQEKTGKKNLYDREDPWILNILNALKAEYLYKFEKDYIILDGKICIVDEFTGRIMKDRRWSLGIHEAIEAKENLEIGLETKTKTSITYQNFFTLYPKLAGMTGTAKSAEKEFQDIYNLEVIVIPTAKPILRQDRPDFVYQSELAKWKAVVKQAQECFQRGQPILIGTASVEKSEFLSELFQATNPSIPHQILNAKPENVARESEIIAQAGKPYAVTIATNMAGRGTDIILGGKQKKNDVNLDNLKEENKKVKEAGGLFVLGTERAETRRIDDQLRGRAGRQGDPGVSQFFVSLEDELIKLFGGENISRWIDFLVLEKDEPLESPFLTKSLETAQQKIENYNYEVRKTIFDYDDLVNQERKQIFEIRNQILGNKKEGKIEIEKDQTINLKKENSFSSKLIFFESAEFEVDEEIEKRTQFERKKNNKREKEIVSSSFFDTIESIIDKYTTLNFSLFSTLFNSKSSTFTNFDWYQEAWISLDGQYAESELYSFLLFQQEEILPTLEILDYYWTEHIEQIQSIRDTINWRAYGQETPLIEYNLETSKSFEFMFKKIRSSLLYYAIDNYSSSNF
jgi:preprotein translocase subunit SecA